MSYFIHRRGRGFRSGHFFTKGKTTHKRRKKNQGLKFLIWNFFMKALDDKLQYLIKNFC
jgi:hypothetical protein